MIFFDLSIGIWTQKTVAKFKDFKKADILYIICPTCLFKKYIHFAQFHTPISVLIRHNRPLPLTKKPTKKANLSDTFIFLIFCE